MAVYSQIQPGIHHLCRGLRLEHLAIKSHRISIEEYFFHIVVVMIMHAWFLVPLLFSKDWSQMGKIQQTVFCFEM